MPNYVRGEVKTADKMYLHITVPYSGPNQPDWGKEGIEIKLSVAQLLDMLMPQECKDSICCMARAAKRVQGEETIVDLTNELRGINEGYL